jgi:hypothetical protein
MVSALRHFITPIGKTDATGFASRSRYQTALVGRFATSRASQGVNGGYNYDIHSVKSNKALLTISGMLAVHGATGHRLILLSPPLTHSGLGERHASI